MAVVTGTPWDLALDQRAYSAPPPTAAAPSTASSYAWPVAPAPASATPHSNAAAYRLSARAAYQDALYRRTLLVDLRSAQERGRDGDLDQALKPVPVHPRELIGWLVERGSDRDIALISDDGAQAAAVANALADVGLAQLGYVTGGFAAWSAAGLAVT